MHATFQSVTERLLPCKCCGNAATIFGVVDFNKNCVIGQRLLDPCGIPIYYHRCQTCGFIFTTALDGFNSADFASWIYNDQYPLLDPDYAEKRPRENAEFFVNRLGHARDIQILDYGGGHGKLAQLLRDGGFRSVTTYDPFVPEFSARPQGRHDLVLCFEAVEHATNPRGMFNDLHQLMKPDGMIIFSTLFQQSDIEKIGVNWWYIAPRNGHVSIFTNAAMQAIAQPLGLKFGSFNSAVHVLLHEKPAFANNLF